MTKREAFLTALGGGQPESHVPLWEMEFQIYCHYHESDLILGHEYEKLTPVEQEKALHHNVEVFVTVSEKLGFCAITGLNNYWEIAPGEGAWYWLPLEARQKQLRLLRQAVGQEYGLVAFAGGLVFPPSDSIEEFCYQLYDHPEKIDEQAERLLEGGIEDAHRARDCGADAVFCPCDIADNHGVFFPPQMMDRFWWPYLDRLADAVHDAGLKMILHSDGNLTKILDRLASSNLDALQSIDPIAGMDMAETKAIVGTRLCLCGNVDIGLLQLGSPEKIEAKCRETLEAGKPGGAFLFGGTNAIFPEVPKESYDAMNRAWRKYGKY